MPKDLIVSRTAAVALGILLRKVYACTPIALVKSGLPLWATPCVCPKATAMQTLKKIEYIFIKTGLYVT
jgi:hypothetical protein